MFLTLRPADIILSVVAESDLSPFLTSLFLSFSFFSTLLSFRPLTYSLLSPLLLQIRWEKNITLGEPPGFLHSWWWWVSLLLYILTWCVYLHVLSRFSPLLHPPDLASAVQPNTTLFISIISRSESSYKRGTQWTQNVALMSVEILLVVIRLF